MRGDRKPSIAVVCVCLNAKNRTQHCELNIKKEEWDTHTQAQILYRYNKRHQARNISPHTHKTLGRVLGQSYFCMPILLAMYGKTTAS